MTCKSGQSPAPLRFQIFKVCLDSRRGGQRRCTLPPTRVLRQAISEYRRQISTLSDTRMRGEIRGYGSIAIEHRCAFDRRVFDVDDRCARLRRRGREDDGDDGDRFSRGDEFLFFAEAVHRSLFRSIRAAATQQGGPRRTLLRIYHGARPRALYRARLVLRFIASPINVRQKVARFEGGRHPPSRGTVEERPSIAFEDIAKDNGVDDPELRSRGVRGQALSIVDLRDDEFTDIVRS